PDLARPRLIPYLIHCEANQKRPPDNRHTHHARCNPDSIEPGESHVDELIKVPIGSECTNDTEDGAEKQQMYFPVSPICEPGDCPKNSCKQTELEQKLVRFVIPPHTVIRMPARFF